MKKQLIVNNSINPSLSKDEFLSFLSEPRAMLQGCWVMVVGCKSSSVSLPECPDYKTLERTIIYGDFVARQSMAEQIFERYTSHKQLIKDEAFQDDYKKGQTLGKAFAATFKPKGVLSFNTAQFLGLAEELLYSFNHFDKAKLISVVKQIHGLNITNNYGDNNPNTGSECLRWAVSFDTLDTVWCEFRGELSITPLTYDEVMLREGEITSILKSTNPTCIKREDEYWPSVSSGKPTDRILATRFRLFWD